MAMSNIKYDEDKIKEAEDKLKVLQELMEDLKDIEDLISQKTHYLEKLNDDLFDMVDDKEELFERIENTIKLIAVMLTAQEMDVDIKKMISSK